jgi:hypothetical protein
VDKDHWQCDICGFKGSFAGARDTIKAHMLGKDHSAAVARQGVGPSKTQPTVVAAFASAVASGVALYPTNYVPKLADIPGPDMHSFLNKHRCHGWIADYVMIGGVQHNVRPLLLDLHPGESWYADPHYHRHAPLALGTFWHVDCEGFNCSKC